MTSGSPNALASRKYLPCAQCSCRPAIHFEQPSCSSQPEINPARTADGVSWSDPVRSPLLTRPGLARTVWLSFFTLFCVGISYGNSSIRGRSTELTVSKTYEMKFHNPGWACDSYGDSLQAASDDPQMQDLMAQSKAAESNLPTIHAESVGPL